MMVPRAAEAVRPRVEGEREAEILDAAVELLVEHGYDRLTMDAVAVRAKASKATLYRRWSSKHLLVLDAVLRSKKHADPVDEDTGSLRGDLVASYCGDGGMTQGDGAAMLGAVITALHTDEEFARGFRDQFLLPKINMTLTIFERARERGELLECADPSLLGPALAGILLHRSILMGEEIDAAIVERVIDAIILPAATGARPI